MAEKLLTDIRCRQASSGGTKIRKLHDGGGLYLWAYADGRKYWRLRFWVGGKEKSLSLGTYPKVSLKDARDKLAEQRKLLAGNLDPSAERKAGKLAVRKAAANTFKAVAEEWYGKQAHLWSATHASDIRRRLEKDLYPSLGKRPISEIDVPELLEVLEKIEQRAPDLAHRLRALCSAVFRYAITRKLCQRDPAADLRGALSATRVTNMPALNAKELPELLRAIAGYSGDRQTVLGLQLLARTFVRTGELIKAEWEEFSNLDDPDNALWTIPAERMKARRAHVVPLTRQMLTILAELKTLSRSSKFVFPSRTRGSGKPMSGNTLIFALHRMGYKGRQSGHGFRALASTVLNESNFNSDWIEAQLAHLDIGGKTRAAYNRSVYLDERRKMMQWWSNFLDAAEGGAVITPIFSAA